MVVQFSQRHHVHCHQSIRKVTKVLLQTRKSPHVFSAVLDYYTMTDKRPWDSDVHDAKNCVLQLKSEKTLVTIF